MTTLKTERLILQPMTLDDAADMFRIFSHPDAMGFMPTPPHENVEQTHNMLQWDMSREGAYMWAIRLKNSDTVIGQMHYLGGTRVPGMGYILHPDYWGQGIVAEAAQVVLNYGFEQIGYDRVELWIDQVNTASIRVAQKLGFTLRGQFVNKFQHRSRQHIVLVWGMLAQEWRKSASDPSETDVQFFGVEPVLMVHDVQATAQYYQDKLGFRIDFLYGDPPNHGGVSRGMWSGAMTSIQLSQVPPEREIVPSGHLYIRVDAGLDALYEQYNRKGVIVLAEPDNKPWGLREFVIKDMNGHVLVFATPI